MVEHLLAKERVESSNLFIRFWFQVDFCWFTTELVQVLGKPFDGGQPILLKVCPGMSGVKGLWLR